MSNIEMVARDICARQVARTCCSDNEIAADVDRYWHCVAAELESGQIDEAGNSVMNFRLEESLGAYRDWCRRHPASKQA
jgi:hypothetical protein